MSPSFVLVGRPDNLVRQYLDFAVQVSELSTTDFFYLCQLGFFAPLFPDWRISRLEIAVHDSESSLNKVRVSTL